MRGRTARHRRREVNRGRGLLVKGPLLLFFIHDVQTTEMRACGRLMCGTT